MKLTDKMFKDLIESVEEDLEIEGCSRRSEVCDINAFVSPEKMDKLQAYFEKRLSEVKK